MGWDGTFVPYGNRSLLVEESINFYLAPLEFPLLEILERWVEKKVVVEVDKGRKIEGILEEVNPEKEEIVVSGRKIKKGSIVRILRLKPQPVGWGI